MNRIPLALLQIESAREATLELLDTIPDSEWFRFPDGAPTHIAWQAGHIAAAQYHLALERIRGAKSEDAELIPADFRAKFGKGSVPCADPSVYPLPHQIRETLDAVMHQTLSELILLPEAELAKPPQVAVGRIGTKWDSIIWSCLHEMQHTGKIGLLRRMLGYKPLW